MKSMLKTKTNISEMGWNICQNIFSSQTQVIYIIILYHKGITIVYLRSPQKKKKT